MVSITTTTTDDDDDMKQRKQDDIGDDDDIVTSLLNSVLVKEPSKRLKQKQDYEDRLLTFHPGTYFAKPACLSPLMCARFGWKNVDHADMLVCTSCHAALSITSFDVQIVLSSTVSEKVCTMYRIQLATSHDPDCIHYMSKEQFEKLDETYIGYDNNDNDAKSLDTVVPAIMANVLPNDSMKLMEHPNPIHILRKNVQSFLSALPYTDTPKTTTTNSIAPTTFRYPKLEFPYELKSFFKDWIRNNDTNIDSTKDNDDNVDDDGDDEINSFFVRTRNLLSTNDDAIILLVLFGWILIHQENVENENETDERTTTKITVGCPLCFASLVLEVIDESTTTTTIDNNKVDNDEDADADTGTKDDNPPPSKRLRRKKLVSLHNPLQHHRHYCPFRSGFPKSMSTQNANSSSAMNNNNKKLRKSDIPVWKTITSRLLEKNKNNSNGNNNETPNDDHDNDDDHDHLHVDWESSLKNIGKILNAGIASFRFKE